LKVICFVSLVYYAHEFSTCLVIVRSYRSDINYGCLHASGDSCLDEVWNSSTRKAYVIRANYHVATAEHLRMCHKSRIFYLTVSPIFTDTQHIHNLAFSSIGRSIEIVEKKKKDDGNKKKCMTTA
jgi:hypothetical protein